MNNIKMKFLQLNHSVSAIPIDPIDTSGKDEQKSVSLDSKILNEKK